MHSPFKFDTGKGRYPTSNVSRHPTADHFFTGGLSVLDSIRTNITLYLVTGYIVLNTGFMMLRFPPGGHGAPIGELWLAVVMATIFLDLQFVRPFVNWAPAVPVFCWWLLGIFHLITEVPTYGFWAIRDAGHWMELNYLWVGFAVASRPDFYKRFEKWLRLTVSIGVYYMFTYPFQKTVSDLSPKVQALAGWSAPLFGIYSNASGNVVTGLFLVLLDRHATAMKAAWKFSATAFAVVVMVVFLQMRTGYLQFVMAIALLMYCRPRSVGRFGILVLGVLLIGAILLNLNIDLTGRTGQKFSVDFLLDHIKAIWGGGGYDVRSSAEGVDLRMGWWRDNFNKVNSSIGTALFGLGFGVPLTNFHGPAGGVVREVHNSFISTYARLGLFGLVLFLVINVRIYFVGLRLIQIVKPTRRWPVVVSIGTLLCFLACQIIFSFGEGGMEVSYVAIPYYFLAGVLFALNRRIRLEIRAGPRRA